MLQVNVLTFLSSIPEAFVERVRFESYDVGSHADHIEVLRARPVLGRAHQRAPNAGASRSRVDNETNQLRALTRFQEHSCLRCNPAREVRSAFGDSDKMRRRAQEHCEPSSDLRS